MRRQIDTSLDRLQGHYADVLALTRDAARLLADVDRAEDLRERYASTRFARVNNVVPPRPLTALMTTLGSILAPLFEEVAARHEAGPDGTLSYGSRFWRVDPACAPSASSREKLELLLDRLGFTAFGSELGTTLAPLVRRIVGDVTYRRVYLYKYEEGDYIGAHDDHHVGNRVDVQFPVTVDGVGGIRVLSDGLFRMHYDTPGAMNILGPSMWHDVPPVLRVSRPKLPRRYNLGLRFTPE